MNRVLLFAFLSLSIIHGCARDDSESRMIEVGEKTLIQSGQIFERYRSFRSIKSSRRLSDKQWSMQLQLDDRVTDCLLTLETQYFQLFTDQTYLKYLSKWGADRSMIEAIEQGFIKAIAAYTIMEKIGATTTTYEYVAFFTKLEDENDYSWKFTTLSYSPYRRLLHVIQKAYQKETDKEFKNF